MTPSGPGDDIGLTAYRLGSGSRVEPAARWRDWMDATDERFANRCLPLLMANQAGWQIALDHEVRAYWSGGSRPADVVVETDSPLAPKGHFGHGILTFHTGFLLRTDPGWNVLVRGPANAPKDGVCALEGLVESDVASAPFTVNWRFTRSCDVRWEAGEPIAMIVPQRRGDLERVRPEVSSLAGSPALERDYARWRESRATFARALRGGDDDARARGWERHYFRGTEPGGQPFDEHQTVLRLAPFQEPGAPPE